MHDHADKQHHGKLGFALVATHSPARFEDLGEDEGVHGQLNTGLKKDQARPMAEPL